MKLVVAFAFSALLALGCSAVAGEHSNNGSGGNASLDAGTDTNVSNNCSGLQVACNGACINPLDDVFNCGICGNVCATGTSCIGGQCQGAAAECPVGYATCSGVCTDVSANLNNCGMCGVACSAGQQCSGGACSCQAGLSACSGACVDTQSDGLNCGTCGNACPVGQVCSLGACSDTCATGLEACGQSCVDLNQSIQNCGACGNACGTGEVCSAGSCSCSSAGEVSCSGICTNTMADAANCGTCGNTCAQGQTCNAGVCSGGTCAVAGQTACDGVCVNTTTDPANCGTCGEACEQGQTCSGGMCVGNNPDNCPLRPGMISHFEGQSLNVASHNGWVGTWEAFNGGGGTHTIAVERWGTETCNEYALHTKGSGTMSYVGIGFSLKGTPESPTVYNASEWTGIRFRARLGGNTTSPVRFNISTPWTEGSENPGGACTGTGCYNHVGRFLHQENALTTDWKEYTFCFDRDLYPQFLPSNLTTSQRRQIANNLLKVQFVFNAAKNLSSNTNPLPEYAKTEPFDFWVDDIEFVTDSCDARPQPFSSSSGTAKPYPQEGAAGTVGNCTRPADADKFSHAIAQAYLRWKSNFVRAGNPGQRVLSPEQGDDTPSEAMGYGMMIAAAMGDKATFDQFWTYTNSQLVNGLMKWSRNGSGSATDADVDIAYALALAAQQWSGGSYLSNAQSMIAAIKSQDITSNRLKPGSNWGDRQEYNASYFTPSFFPVFASITSDTSWTGSILSTNYGIVNSCATQFSNGAYPPDWCMANNGSPVDAASIGAQVQSLSGTVYAFDAARVPWRLGLHACLQNSNDARTRLNSLIGFFSSQYDNGEGIDRMLAGWRGDRTAHPQAQENQMSFIGPIGVGAMATTHTAARERAFRAVLDIMENPEFNRTYYPATVGLITLLQMSGNFPHRTN